MCGICGLVGDPDRRLLERMTATLIHRGPDEVGYWQDERVAFGIRRLAIIDPDTGQQPVFNEDGTLCAVFNGEIYNYVELRRDLEDAGHRFRSDHSDSEVIVHLYEEHGLDFLNKLNGMFAIALWDARAGRLILARDRAGVKPLYFARIVDGLAFASEIKALLVHPAISRTPDFVALHHYFSLKNIPAPHSAFRDIEQLRPGELAIFESAELRRQRWWALRFQEDSTIDERMATRRIRELLEDSVRLRMRSDVPFGAYLSGGVDSSSVVALMSRIGGRRIETFTLAYEEDLPSKTTDRTYAREVSALYNTNHHEEVISYRDVPDGIEDIVEAFDEPFSGVISTYFLSRLISRHVKVALSGDGADELFASYRPHRLATPLRFVAENRNRLDDLSETEKSALEAYGAELDLLLKIAERGDEAAQRMDQYLCDDAGKWALYSNVMKEAVGTASTEECVRHVLAASATSDPLNRILYLDFETLLPDQVLPFIDRLSMAHSVEVRTPYLDYRLMEFLGTLPGTLKIRGGRVKHVLKEAVRGLIPDAILDRPKEGFIMPINQWLLAHYRSLVEDVLSPRRLARHGLFRNEAIAQMIAEHYAGRLKAGDRLWNLMMFQLWWERYVG